MILMNCVIDDMHWILFGIILFVGTLFRYLR